MPARRRLLWVSLALSLGLLGIAVSAGRPPADPGGSAPVPAPEPTAASAPLVARITVAPSGLPAYLVPGPPARTGHQRPSTGTAPVVQAQLGQRVELTVSPPQPDAVWIPGFDRIRPGSPSTPASFSLVADRVGRFAVLLRSTGRTVATLQVGRSATTAQ